MSFSMISFRESVERRLASMRTVDRRMFTLWCLQRTLDQFGDCVEQVLSEDELRSIKNALRYLAGCITTNGREANTAILKAIQRTAIPDGDYGLASIIVVQVFGGIDSMSSTFDTDDPHQSMLLADFLVDCVDAKVSFENGISVSDLAQSPEIWSEIKSVEDMLEFLEKSPELTLDDLYR